MCCLHKLAVPPIVSVMRGTGWSLEPKQTLHKQRTDILRDARILKVVRTVADLDGVMRIVWLQKQSILPRHEFTLALAAQP